MEPIQGSETSAFNNNQTPGKYPEEFLSSLQHGESLKHKMMYFAYFHSLLEYGIAFWGNSTESFKVFKLQKRGIRLMNGSNVRTSCRPLFPMLGIMTLPSQYIFCLMRFLSRNLEFYTPNSTNHNYNTRNRIPLHKPSSLLTIYQKGLYYESVGVFNKLPHNTAERISHNKSFLTTLKKYPLGKAFYSIDEYMNDYLDGCGVIQS